MLPVHHLGARKNKKYSLLELHSNLPLLHLYLRGHQRNVPILYIQKFVPRQAIEKGQIKVVLNPTKRQQSFFCIDLSVQSGGNIPTA